MRFFIYSPISLIAIAVFIAAFHFTFPFLNIFGKEIFKLSFSGERSIWWIWWRKYWINGVGRWRPPRSTSYLSHTKYGNEKHKKLKTYDCDSRSEYETWLFYYFNRLSPLEINPRKSINFWISASLECASRLIDGAIFRCLAKSQYRFWQFLLSFLSNLVPWICFSMHFKRIKFTFRYLRWVSRMKRNFIYLSNSSIMDNRGLVGNQTKLNNSTTDFDSVHSNDVRSNP